MSKQELIGILRALKGYVDKEAAHSEADELLLKFIDDAEVTKAFKELTVWYA